MECILKDNNKYLSFSSALPPPQLTASDWIKEINKVSQFLFLLRYKLVKNWIWLITFTLFIMVYIKLTICHTVFSQDSTPRDIQDNAGNVREWTSQNPDLNISGMRCAPIVPISPDGAQERAGLPKEAGLCCRSINKVLMLWILTYVWCLTHSLLAPHVADGAMRSSNHHADSLLVSLPWFKVYNSVTELKVSI